MTSRRKFLKLSALGATTAGVAAFQNTVFSKGKPIKNTVRKPVVISTWNAGIQANEEAWKTLGNNGYALDAVENGVKIIEADLSNLSVGLGGLPDRDGFVTLDASIMNEKGDAGSVAFLQHFLHPVSVARMVMEKSPHVMLVGEGAEKFALANGFTKETTNLTPQSEKAYKEWLKQSDYKPVINVENHDTIGMVALDNAGKLCGVCTTSGLAYKIHGRVGDSPVIGAGLYVDNEIGAACATGLGESIMKVCGSFLVVENMRHGMSPTDACREAIERLIKRNPDYRDMQAAFIALNKNGDVGSYAIQKGFTYAIHDSAGNRLVDSDYWLK